MRFPRFKLSIRSLMLAVLAAGLVLGVVAYRLELERRRADLQLLFSRQFEVTEKILNEGEAEANTLVGSLSRPGPGIKGLGGRGSGSNEHGWFKALQMHFNDGPENRQVVNLQISGRSWDLRQNPILIRDGGGELNPKIIERLVRAYREKGWAYRHVIGTRYPEDEP